LEKREKIVIAIDGPAGSGKSSTAKKVAELLNYIFLDSGAMYRAVTLQALRCHIELQDEKAAAELAAQCHIEFREDESQQKVYLNGEDVSAEIRTPQVTRSIAPIAANPAVREILVEKQSYMGENGGIVAEGRDMTSVVFPDAELKVYMQASVEERAKRRFHELQAKGVDVSMQELIDDIRQRDASDSNREHGALQIVADAFVIDTSELEFDEQVHAIVKKARERGA